MRLIVALALLLDFFYCSVGTAPDGGLHVIFISSSASYQRLPGGPVVTPSPGRIEVKGAITTGDPCVKLRAESSGAARRIAVTVVARRENVACAQVVSDFAYQTTVQGLEPGRYQLVLSHAWEDPAGARRSSQLVLNQTVTVP